MSSGSNTYTTYKATELTSNAGSTTQPIYFSGGKPVAITGNIANGTTGNAATATAFKDSQSITLTGDTTGSSSSTAGWSIATTTKYLSGAGSSSAVPTTNPGAGKITYYYNVNTGLTGNMPTSNNANGILQINRHSGNYCSQLGFSSNGNLYYRYFNGTEIDTTTIWKQIAYTTSDITGNAATVSRATFGDQNNGEHNANNIASNGLYYYTSNGPDKTANIYASTDGAIYCQAHSTTWVAQIAQDYRTGAIAYRGKNNGTWTSWLSVPAMKLEDYPALLPSNGVNNWIKIGTSNASYGLLPSTAGNAQNGHNYLGTSSWYWKYLYVDQINSNWLHIVHNSSNNSDDALVYIENQNGSDWAEKIKIGAYNYGLYVEGTGTYLLKIGTNNNFYVNSDYVGTNLLFKITANSNTVTIGSQNASFCHIHNSASIPFIFNNTVLTTSGSLGNATYPFANLYLKGNGNGVYYVGTKNTYRMIRFIDNTSDTYGNGISIGGGGQTIIGGGESADVAVGQAGAAGAEIMQICNDGDVQIFSNMQNGWDSRKEFKFNTAGNLIMPSGARIGESGGALYLGNSGNQNWVYVQDIASQTGTSYWSITQAGVATFSGGVKSQHGHILNVAGNEFNWIPDAYNSTMWLNYDSFGRTNNSTISEYICGNGKHGQADLRANKVYNAVWNDFAEFREGECTEAGYVVAVTQNSNRVDKTTERLQPCAHIISDTFGCSVGESDTAKTPIGVAGRVLVYPYRLREEYNIGDCLCAAPGGTADIMTREEIMMYPDRIIGIVDEIPDYEVWNQVLTTAKPEDRDKIEGGRQNRHQYRGQRAYLDLHQIMLSGLCATSQLKEVA